MLILRAASFFLASLVITAAPARAQDKITLGGVGAGSAIHWPVYIATEKGFFRKRNLVVDYVPVPASANVMQQLAAGSLDLGVSGTVDAVRAIDQGAPLSLLRIEAGPSGYEIFTKSSIKSAAELKGKTVMIGGIKDITRFYIESVLGPAGLKPADYDYVFAGATAQRYAALVSGSIDATILAAPFNFTARKAGFTNLGAPPSWTHDVPFGVFSVRVDWAKRNKGKLDAFLGGFSEAVDFFYGPQGAEAVDILKKVSPTVDRADAERTFAFYREIKAFENPGAIEAPRLELVVKYLKEQGDLGPAVTPQKLFDPQVAVGR